MAKLRDWYAYHADNGSIYRVYIPVWYRDAASGEYWAAPVGHTYPELPRGMRMRRLTLRQVGGTELRQYPANATGTTIWPRPTFTFTIPNSNGTSSTYTAIGYVSERYQPATNRRKH